MPSESRAQQKLAGMELERKEEGEPAKTSMGKMSESELRKFARGSMRGKPEHARKTGRDMKRKESR